MYRSLPPEAIEGPAWSQIPRVYLRPVCLGCQRRLAELFENRASPLLKELLAGSFLNLLPGHQVLLAAWVAKTALVLGLSHRRGRPTPPLSPQHSEVARSELFGMLETGLPPASMSVRVGALPPYIALDAGATVWPTAVPPEWTDKAWITSSVVSLPRLVCEAVIWNDVGLAERFLAATEHDQRFVGIWPQNIASSRMWPPPLPVLHLDVPALREAWTHAPEEDVLGGFPRLKLPAVEPPPDDQVVQETEDPPTYPP